MLRIQENTMCKFHGGVSIPFSKCTTRPSDLFHRNNFRLLSGNIFISINHFFWITILKNRNVTECKYWNHPSDVETCSRYGVEKSNFCCKRATNQSSNFHSISFGFTMKKFISRNTAKSSTERTHFNLQCAIWVVSRRCSSCFKYFKSWLI